MDRYEELIDMALDARKLAYAPYSKFKVGAALLGKNGVVYMGCNVENASYPATNCAERTAFFRAVYEGEREFTKIAIVGGMEGTDGNATCAPCGVCRQVMREFCNPETFIVYLGTAPDNYQKYLLKELFPFGFGSEDLK